MAEGNDLALEEWLGVLAELWKAVGGTGGLMGCADRVAETMRNELGVGSAQDKGGERCQLSEDVPFQAHIPIRLLPRTRPSHEKKPGGGASSAGLDRCPNPQSSREFFALIGLSISDYIQ